MTRIALEPTRMELGIYREQYEALVEHLEAEGYEVELLIPRWQVRNLPGPL